MSDSNDKKWFEKVRFNSWEVEILIVACILAFLFNIPESLNDYILQNRASDHFDWRGHKSNVGNFWYGIGIYKLAIIYIVMLCILIAKVTFCLYIFLRGFWVAAIGISSVFPKGVDVKRLNFSSDFHKLLPKNSFDHFIERLDNICSSIFGLGFLVAFFLLSLTVYMILSSVFIMPFQYFFQAITDGIITWILIILWGVGVIFFLDILLLGLFKKIKWKVFSFPYSKVYKLLRIITLFFIYEPMYYLFISNVRLKASLFFLLSLIAIPIVSNQLDSDGYISFSYNDIHQSKTFMLNKHYEDRLLTSMENFGSTRFPFINSEIISGSYLKLNIPFHPYIHSSLDSACGITSQIMADDQNIENEILLDCINNVYAIYIDDDTIVSNFVLYDYAARHFSMSTFFMPISMIKYQEGKHVISVEKLFPQKYVFPEDSMSSTGFTHNSNGVLSKAADSLIHIPFYIYR